MGALGVEVDGLQQATVLGDTPVWDAVLAEHHAKLVKAGVQNWASEGARLVRGRGRKPRNSTTPDKMSP